MLAVHLPILPPLNSTFGEQGSAGGQMGATQMTTVGCGNRPQRVCFEAASRNIIELLGLKRGLSYVWPLNSALNLFRPALPTGGRYQTVTGGIP